MTRPAPRPSPGKSSSDTRASLARMVMRLFDHWALAAEDQLNLLGLSPDSRTTLKRYREGGRLSDNRDLLDRVGHLLGIHKSLRILFPRNRELAYRWMSTRNTQFAGHTPVELVKQRGFAGLLMVRAYLDRERGR